MTVVDYKIPEFSILFESWRQYACATKDPQRDLKLFSKNTPVQTAERVLGACATKQQMSGKMSPFKTVLILVLSKVFSADALVSTSFPIGTLF